MSEYAAPLRDMQFVLSELVDLPSLLKLPGFEAFEADTLVEVLEQAGAFASEVLAPLHRSGDREGCRLEGGVVRTPQGWREAYARFAADGWNALGCSARIGGHGLPAVISAMVEEMWHSANAAFALCPMLTRSGIESIDIGASAELKQRYLPALVAGRWTATMNLTEPQAGSDLAAVKTRAVRQADGSYRLSGQKIFITYGQHEMTENIVHLVLARTADAPAGVRGTSLFIVPKFLVQSDGALGAANRLRCLSIEHKLGIHGSPTCVMQYGGDGDAEGAQGWLVGEENRGIEYMFIMMNAARYSVGVQGLGIAERAYQQALRYARERRQGTEPGANGASVPILRHPDVRRMLLTMKARVEAMRALAAVVAEAVDHARTHPDTTERRRAQAFVALLTPVVKGWYTESAVEMASIGIQVHGGSGYIEESGAPQLLRDARIAPIYEGTTGIQANDLVGRKIVRDGGEAARDLIAAMRRGHAELVGAKDASLERLGAVLEQGIEALDEAVRFTVTTGRDDPMRASCGAEPLLRLFGIVAGGWQLARAALAARRRLAERAGEIDFYESKILTARFYADHILSQAAGLAQTVRSGAEALLAIRDEQF